MRLSNIGEGPSRRKERPFKKEPTITNAPCHPYKKKVVLPNQVIGWESGEQLHAKTQVEHSFFCNFYLITNPSTQRSSQPKHSRSCHKHQPDLGTCHTKLQTQYLNNVHKSSTCCSATAVH